ncbi:MAG TPA: hypothetical protein VJ845_00500 [Haploplasma sp.]|nr:hypothetical protein [Haploplasma sp.]
MPNKDNKDLRAYNNDKLSNVPVGVKVFILKSWSSGATFFFIYMSTAVFKLLSNHWDRWFLTALVLVLVNEYFINLLIKYMERKDYSMEKYAMCINNKFSLVVNFFYIILVAFLTILLGGFIIDQGISLSRIFFPNEAATWEPIMFGLFYYGVDTGLIFIKNFIVKLIRKNKIQKDEGENEVEI